MNAIGWLVTIALLFGLALIFSALLSGLETLILLLKKHRLKVLMAADPKLGHLWRRLADHAEAYLTQAVVLGVVANLSAALLGVYFVHQSGGPAGGAPGEWLPFGAIALAIFVGVDMFPKLVALRHPALVCGAVAGPFLRASKLLAPMGEPLAKAVAGITRRLIPSHVVPRKQLLSEELPAMVELRGRNGVLLPQESRAIREVLRLSGKTAKDCMTPRHEVMVVDRRLPAADVCSRVRRSFRFWYPVSDGNPDSIVGLLDGWGLILDEENEVELDRHIKPPLRVPETMPAIDLLYRHLNEPHRMAVVIDEYGGFEGVVSHSDLMEEVLEDSVPDPAHEEEILVLQPGRRVQVLGHARLDELGEVLGLALERDGLDTIGGLVHNELGRLPRQHERLRCGRLEIMVTKVIGTRIEEMIVELAEESDERGMEP